MTTVAAIIAGLMALAILAVIAVARWIDRRQHPLYRARRKERMRTIIVDQGREQIIGDGPWR